LSLFSQGDSGGPLVCLVNKTTIYQIGIVSFGDYCALSMAPGVYTDVNAYSEWIKEGIVE